MYKYIDTYVQEERFKGYVMRVDKLSTIRQCKKYAYYN